MTRFLLFLCIASIGFQSCEERKIIVPKQRGYFRIDLPKHEYQKFSENFPYSFNYPKYAHIEMDTLKGAEPYWINIEYPTLKATIHLSYKNVAGDLNKYVEDAHFLVFKHDVKADAINPQEFHYSEKNVHGLFFDIKGDAASVMQFYITDSTEHFLRGALYFNVPPNKDSLAPVINFMRDDVMELISTFEWKKIK
jgi:gliding motility-associated lipoprotein GldD